MTVDVRAHDVAPALRALADPVRWRILHLLAGEELCVCHLVDELGLAQPLVSHHLAVLRRAGLVAPDRFRQWTYYRIVPTELADLAGELSDLATRSGPPRRPCA